MVQIPSTQGFSVDPGQGLLSKSLQSKIDSITRIKPVAPTLGILGQLGALGPTNPPVYPPASTPRPQHSSADKGGDGGPGPQGATGISDDDVLRIAMAVRNLMAAEIQSIVTNLVQCIDTLAEENKKLRYEIDDLEMYSRKNCVRVFGVDEAKTNTDEAIMEIATELEVPLKPEHIVVSHRVGKPNQSRPRAIIARISNYQVRHQLIKSSKNLRDVAGMQNVSVNQELTKTRAKLAYQCRDLVRKKLAKSTFVWDGKIFVMDNKEVKHKVLHLDDLLNVRKALGCSEDYDSE